MDEYREFLERATDSYVAWGDRRMVMRMKWFRVLLEMQQYGT